MKIAKRIGILLLAYVALVVAFESMIGIMQPRAGDTLVIHTTDAGGETSDRVLAHLESQGKIYVAANHWPRAWYNEALENPKVAVTLVNEDGSDGPRGEYLAVPVSDEEHARVHAENNPGLVFRFLTGFPPREFLRLDPRVG